jgi:hypothetical protein
MRVLSDAGAEHVPGRTGAPARPDARHAHADRVGPLGAATAAGGHPRIRAGPPAAGRNRTKIVQGWSKLLANFKALIGIFSQSVGPSLAIWANPVQFSFSSPRRPRRSVPTRLVEGSRTYVAGRGSEYKSTGSGRSTSWRPATSSPVPRRCGRSALAATGRSRHRWRSWCGGARRAPPRAYRHWRSSW